MSLILAAFTVVCVSCGIAAVIGAIFVPKIRTLGLIVAGIGFTFAFLCVAFFVLVVGQMN